MSLVLINFYPGSLLNHIQILIEMTWPQPQGVENLRNVFFFLTQSNVLSIINALHFSRGINKH